MSGEAAPFRGAEYHLDGHRVARLAKREATLLGAEMARLDPWARLKISGAGLAATLSPVGDASLYAPVSFGLYEPGEGGALLGAVAIRPRFLNGPYLALLYVRPDCQSRGTGQAALSFMQMEAQKSGANGLWVSVSAFNSRATSFYRRFGFADVGLVPGLIRDGEDEQLMRKAI